jgi:hypothetical protein
MASFPEIHTSGRLPDFIIAGAMKSGTTTLHHILAQSPAVFIPDGEIHFLDMDDILQHPDFFIFAHKKWWTPRLEEEQAKYFAWYTSFFTGAHETQIVGEDSTTYLSSPQVPERIARFLPQAKIIILLRDPASRTYSHYWHLLHTGRANYNFEDSLQIEPGQLIERSLYKKQIERFFANIPSQHIHVMLFEEFIQNVQAEIREVCMFLEVDTELDISQIDTYRNRAVIPQYPRIQLWYNRIFRLHARRLYFSHLPHSPEQVRMSKFSLMRLVAALHRRVNPTRPSKPPPMKPQTRTFLNAYFARENAGLSELIGKDVQRYWYRD